MEFINKIFSKKIIQTALRKEQWPATFAEHTFHGLLSAEREQKWNALAIWSKG